MYVMSPHFLQHDPVLSFNITGPVDIQNKLGYEWSDTESNIHSPPGNFHHYFSIIEPTCANHCEFLYITLYLDQNLDSGSRF